ESCANLRMSLPRRQAQPSAWRASTPPARAILQRLRRRGLAAANPGVGIHLANAFPRPSVSPRAAIRIVIVNSFDSGPMYAEYLRSRHLVVHWFSSPHAAQPQLADIGPDVIVTDFVFHRGDTDGPSVICTLRTMNGLAEVPIVVVSGYVRAVDRMVAREAGATMFLHKPCLPD